MSPPYCVTAEVNETIVRSYIRGLRLIALLSVRMNSKNSVFFSLARSRYGESRVVLSMAYMFQ